MHPLKVSSRKPTVWKEEIILNIFHLDSFVSLSCSINRNILKRKVTCLGNYADSILTATK